MTERAGKQTARCNVHMPRSKRRGIFLPYPKKTYPQITPITQICSEQVGRLARSSVDFPRRANNKIMRGEDRRQKTEDRRQKTED
jgi:hypothetical protein